MEAPVIDDPYDDEPVRKVPIAVRVLPSMRAWVEELAAERYPAASPSRRMSRTVRDLLLAGGAALAAGFEPGDTIPKKRTR